MATLVAEAEDSLIQRTRALYPLIDGEAEAIERAGTLTAPAVAALKQAGAFDMMVPRELGGGGVDVLTALEVFEEVTRANVAAGWAVLVNATMAACVSTYLSDEAVREVLGDGTAIIAGMIGGQGGRIEDADGGHMFGGKFRFGSASGHATWIAGGAQVRDAAGELVSGPYNIPAVRVALVPREKVELRGNWHDVIGLRGSGSYDYDIERTLVPHGYSFLLLGEPVRRNRPLGHLGVPGLIAVGQAAFPLGAAQRAMEEIARLAPTRARTGYIGPIVEQQMFQYEYAFQEAALEAARAYVRKIFSEAEAYCAANDAPPPMAEFMRLQQTTCYAHRVAMEVVRFCFQWAGSHAVHASPLERIFRDMETANQHLFYDNMNFIRRTRMLFGVG